jgi:hypothetical protein
VSGRVGGWVRGWVGQRLQLYGNWRKVQELGVWAQEYLMNAWVVGSLPNSILEGTK